MAEHQGTTQPPAKRRIIRELDAMYVVPAELDVIRVLLIEDRPKTEGGTRRVYVCLCEEVDCG